MTARTRWLARWFGSAILWSAVALVFALDGEVALTILAIGAAGSHAFQAAASIHLFRSGYYHGRGAMIIEERQRRLGLPLGTVGDVQPWDPFPAWPSVDSDPGHTDENMA